MEIYCFECFEHVFNDTSDFDQLLISYFVKCKQIDNLNFNLDFITICN